MDKVACSRNNRDTNSRVTGICLPSDKGSNWSRGATSDIGSPHYKSYKL